MAFDNSSVYTDYASTLTFAHAVGADADRRLWVSVSYSGSGDTVTGVTYGGVSMTRMDYVQVESLGIVTYVLDAPASGSANVVVSTTGAGTYQCAAISADGVSGATTFLSYAGTYKSSPYTQTITATSGDLIFDVVTAISDVANVFVPDAAQTLDDQITSPYLTVVSHKNASTTGANTMTQTWAGGDKKSLMSIVFKVGQSSGGGSNATGTGAPASITLSVPTGSATGTGGATNGTGTGTLQSIILTAPAGTATGTSAGSGTITTPVMKNNTGTVLANETGVIVNVYNASTGALIVQKTGQTSNASGIVTISDALIVPATTYAYEVVLTGSRRRLPTASAA